MNSRICYILVLLFISLSQAVRAQKVFNNPILPSGPDPWVTYHDGYYYYMNTMGNRLVIWKTNNLAKLPEAEKKNIWEAVPHSNYSHDIWAPELHFLNNRWYVYFAADDGKNDNHRIYVLENKSGDPLRGDWKFLGKVSDKSDKWAIDASVFEYNHQLFMIWSGWEGDVNGEQDIFIARMKNPWTIAGERVKLSRPEFDWEKFGDLPGQVPDHVSVNEGPEILEHDGELFLIYSANGCWTDHYLLGMLKLINKKDILNQDSWYKYPEPVFTGDPDSSVYSPGHNSFFMSPDKKENWILYHANSRLGQGCGQFRSPRMQPFHWKKDGTPDFGHPVSLKAKIDIPSGEKF